MDHRSCREPVFDVLEHQGRTLAWLGRELGVSREWVRQIRNGRARFTAEQRTKIARVLAVPEHLLFRPEE